MKFTNRQGTLRLYDGTATPYYLELEFDNGDFSGPIGAPKTEEILVLHRGTMDSNAHYIEGSDETLLAPVDITFSITVEDTTITTYLLDWLEGNTVNGNTIVTTKGSTQRDGANDNPSFKDSSKKCCNIEFKLDGSNNIVWKYNEVYIPLERATITESEDGVDISFTGSCYGTIERGTSFTSGTDVTS